MKRTFVDAGILIAATRGQGSVSKRALAILEDSDREFVASRFLQLEVQPKAIYHRKQAEAKFYREFFASYVDHWADNVDGLLREALIIASEVGLNAMDALHVAAAAALNCEELITTEKPSAPIYRNRLVRVVFLGK